MDGLEKSRVAAQLARPTFEPAETDAILRVQAPDHVEHVAAQAATGRHFFEGPDTVGSAATYEAALMAAGAGMKAADMVMAGEVRNAFCAV